MPAVQECNDNKTEDIVEMKAIDNKTNNAEKSIDNTNDNKTCEAVHSKVIDNDKAERVDSTEDKHIGDNDVANVINAEDIVESIDKDNSTENKKEATPMTRNKADDVCKITTQQQCVGNA
eukprot:CAMPEP_0113853840 /NCGR_PEP_ID=MMETSP0372-20130328/6772_1 /TAXON_ID=340204 /ORGANISM="Lankesteria abbotti" /LENGTH=119 /DNA_ID=CAMNT_0000826511 /DNA_START=33 /DNA_END=388 /DNA_ORIENTATION=+ /assembly_acc=CAM_ASM_000359